MTKEPTLKKRRPLRWVAVVLFVLFLLALVAVAVTWMFRGPIATSVVERYCADRNLECEVDVAELGLNSAELSSVKVTSGGRDVFKSGPVGLSYTWPNFLEPKLGPIRIDEPELRIGFDGSELDLRGLDRLAGDGNGGGGGSDPVNLNIRDGRIFVETPAGELSGSVNISGMLPKDGTALIKIDPANMQSGENRIAWSNGDASLDISDGRVTGSANFEIDDAQFGELNIMSTKLDATLAGTEDAPVIQWGGTSDAFKYAGQNLSGLTTRGEMQLSELPDGNVTSILEALVAMTAEVSADKMQVVGLTSAATTISLDLKRNGGLVSGPVAMSIKDANSDVGHVDDASLSGRLQFVPNRMGVLAFAGATVLKGTRINEAYRSIWLSDLQTPEPFTAHGEALRAVIDQGLADFDTGTEIRYTQDGESWLLSASRATVLEAASGLKLSVLPLEDPAWLKLTPEGTTMSGEIVVSGGGAPSLQAHLTSVNVAPNSVSVEAENFQLEPWSEAGRTLSVSLAPLRLQSSDARTLLAMEGDVSIAGDFPDTNLRTTTLSGGFEATQGTEGWRVQTRASSCLDFATEGLTSGGFNIQPVALNICPEDGRFIREEEGDPTGKISLGDISVPFATQDSTGTFRLIDSEVNWSVGDTLNAEIRANKLSMPMMLGENTLTVDSVSPLFSVTSGNGPVRFAVTLGASEFGGSLIPANVTSTGFSFVGNATETGIGGVMRSNDVTISDYRADPIYQPLRADLTAYLQDGRIMMTGPLKLKSSGWTIADAKLDMGLTDLNGTAALVGRPLRFTGSGLQPFELSDLLRSTLPNARGSMLGNADFTITEGELAGTGEVKITDLSFDSFSLGEISGVNGTVKFSDILELTTLPSQTVTIANVDPGVPLLDGRVAFQLVGGELLLLEGARWPFAGGEMIITPTEWLLGGETQHITVSAVAIELTELIEALSLDELLRADGTVSGQMPIKIDGPNTFVVGAELEADQNGGTIAYLGDELEAVKGQNTFSDYAIDALKDFRFKVLKLGVDGNISDEIKISAKLQGSNPDILDGSEFIFNIGVDSKLAQLLQSAQSIADSSYLLSVIKSGGGDLDPDLAEVPGQ